MCACACAQACEGATHTVHIQMTSCVRACVAMCAGAFDGLFFDIVEGIVVLMDWKRTAAAMRWFATAMSEPLAHVKDTKMNRWRLQLNGYRFLLRPYGVDVRRLFVVQFHPSLDSSHQYPLPVVEEDMQSIATHLAKHPPAPSSGARRSSSSTSAQQRCVLLAIMWGRCVRHHVCLSWYCDGGTQ